MRQVRLKHLGQERPARRVEPIPPEIHILVVATVVRRGEIRRNGIQIKVGIGMRVSARVVPAFQRVEGRGGSTQDADVAYAREADRDAPVVTRCVYLEIELGW